MPSFRRIDNPSYPICNPIKKGKKINKKISDFLPPRLATMASDYATMASDFQENCQRLQRLSGSCRETKKSAKNIQVLAISRNFPSKTAKIQYFTGGIWKISTF